MGVDQQWLAIGFGYVDGDGVGDDRELELLGGRQRATAHSEGHGSGARERARLAVETAELGEGVIAQVE